MKIPKNKRTRKSGADDHYWKSSFVAEARQSAAWLLHSMSLYQYIRLNAKKKKKKKFNFDFSAI